MYSYYNTSKKNILIKNDRNRNELIYPRIVSPNILQKYIKMNNYRNTNTINIKKFNFSKIPNYGIKNNNLRHKSNPGNNHIYYLNNKNKFSPKKIIHPIKDSESQDLYNIQNYTSLIKLWNDFNIINSYKELFNMILNQLNDEDKEDLCFKEIKELTELKNNIYSLLKEIQFRKKVLKELYYLNKLGETFKSQENNDSSTSEANIKNISDQIEKLRKYTINICFIMKKIKSIIYEGYHHGKYDLNIISQNFGFDKNYLVKMKEEMSFLKEGYIKYYFNIGDLNPFLLKASEKINNYNGEHNIHIVPISNEIKEKIKQCNYYIYQELIYYQNSKINNFSNRAISPCKINNNQYDINNDDDNINNFLNMENNDIDNYNQINKNNEFNEQKNNNNIELNEKSNHDESILFGEKGINIKDIVSETSIKDKDNNKDNNYNNSNNANKVNNISKTNSKNIFDRNTEKFSLSNYSKKSYIDSSKSYSKYSQKNFKVSIYNNYINYFIENDYNEYYKQIPQQEVLMFNLQNNLLSSMLNGIAPFILIVQENFNKNNDDNKIEKIFGICAFNYIYQNNKLILKINHISALVDFNESDYIKNLQIIYGTIINYIKTEFYFDEIFIEFSKNKKNEEIYDIFVDNFNFLPKTFSIKRNQNESNGGEQVSNSENNQIHFLIYRNKIQINDTIKKSITSLFGNNLFHFFNSILLTNADKISNLDNFMGNNFLSNKSFKELTHIDDLKYSNSDLYINIVAINNIFKSKDNSISNIYHRITSLDQLIKVFLQNKINNEEIPLSAAENRFDILCCVMNKIINETLNNSPKLINNYNIYNSKSFLDEKTGIFYNFMKPEKIYTLYSEENSMTFYIISNNLFAIFFIQFNNNKIKKYLLEKNLYIKINEIYKDLISSNIIDILENKFIWIPCFNIYKHLKCLINNSTFTVHEYICISNTIINSNKKKKKDKKNDLLFNNNLKSFLIEPQINNDIILDNDFIIGIINNASFFSKTSKNKNENQYINDKEKIGISNSSIKSGEESEKNKKSKNDINSTDFPHIAFLNYISKKDFSINDENEP